MGKHYVPQKYLRGFEVPTKPFWIWMYDKTKGTKKLLPIDKVAQEADFYPPEVEKELTFSIEGPANPVLEKLRAGGTIDDIGDRLHLARYIACMIRRVPHGRSFAENLAPQALADVMEATRNAFKEAAKNGRITAAKLEARMAEIESLEKKYQQELPQKMVDAIESPMPSQEMIEGILAMDWSLLQCNGPSLFLTSDNPGFYFEGMGLGDARAELILPISSNLLLHCSWVRRETSLIQIEEKLVKSLNQRAAGGADRFVFYHANKDWVLEVAKNRVEQMSRIIWT